MRRRLDLALSLVHRPSIVFLDEPTTGLDIQSRTALWDEVRRLAKDEGVTVFLTTQYLEEADVLADRVGIIDHGHIVAEGTPAALKAEVGRATVEVVPEPRRTGRAPRARSSSSATSSPAPGTPSRFDSAIARRTSSTSCARSTARASRSPTSSFTPRRSTTSSSRRPAASSKGPAQARNPSPRPPSPRSELEAAVGGRSRIERVPTEMLKVWMAERRVHQIEGEPAAPVPDRRSSREGRSPAQRLRSSARSRSGARASTSSSTTPRSRAGTRLSGSSRERRHRGSPLAERHLGERQANRLPTLLAPGDLITSERPCIEVRPDASS